MDRIAHEEKAAAKTRARDCSRSHEERLELWEHTPQIRTQQVQSGQKGGGSQTTRFRGTEACRIAIEALKGAKGNAKCEEQQKGKKQGSRDAPYDRRP